jgi:hypothetical protein
VNCRDWGKQFRKDDAQRLGEVTITEAARPINTGRRSGQRKRSLHCREIREKNRKVEDGKKGYRGVGFRNRLDTGER